MSECECECECECVSVSVCACACARACACVRACGWWWGVRAQRVRGYQTGMASDDATRTIQAMDVFFLRQLIFGGKNLPQPQHCEHRPTWLSPVQNCILVILPVCLPARVAAGMPHLQVSADRELRIPLSRGA